LRKVSRAIRLKRLSDLRGIRASGLVSAGVLRMMEEWIRPGVSTAELDRLAEDYIRSHGGVPAFKGYRGFPATICSSVNEEIIHAIPSGRRVLREGDVITIDVGTVLNGYFSDTARTYFVGEGEPPEEVGRLLEGTESALWAGIRRMRTGGRLGEVSAAIEEELARFGLTVIRELTGHGVGFELHEPAPVVYNFGSPDEGPVLEDGLVIAIEPMASLGSGDIIPCSDGWTYKTRDGSLSAHFEHTVGLWQGEPVVLTDPDWEVGWSQDY